MHKYQSFQPFTMAFISLHAEKCPCVPLCHSPGVERATKRKICFWPCALLLPLLVFCPPALLLPPLPMVVVVRLSFPVKVSFLPPPIAALPSPSLPAAKSGRREPCRQWEEQGRKEGGRERGLFYAGTTAGEGTKARIVDGVRVRSRDRQPGQAGTHVYTGCN